MFKRVLLLLSLVFFYSILPAQKCKESVEKQIKELESLIEKLDKNGFTKEYVEQMLQWSDRFKAEHQAFDGWGIAKTTTEGTIVGGLANILAAGSLGASSLGIGAVLAISYSEMSRWAANTANLWYKANLNSEIYSWLAEYVDTGKKLPASDLLVDFVGQNKSMLKNLLKETPPSDRNQLRDYLARHAYELFYFLGRMEEMLGPSKFVRHKWPYIQGAHGGNRMEVGYYRKVMKAQIKRELLQLKSELQKLPKCEDTQKEESSTPAKTASSAVSSPSKTTTQQTEATDEQQPPAKTNTPAKTSTSSTTPTQTSSLPVLQTDTSTAVATPFSNPGSVPAFASYDTSGMPPFVGGSIGFGGAKDADFGVCAGVQYQHPIGQRFGNCQSQLMVGAEASFEYTGFKNEFNSFNQQWACLAPRVALFTPISPRREVQLISGLRVPLGLGSSNNKDNYAGSGEEFGSSHSKLGAELFTGVAFDIGKFNLQATTDLFSFSRQSNKPNDFPDQATTSNSFSYLFNKHNQLKLSLNMPLGGRK
ncbi:MAG: hypothetical protein D6730_17895 [Bacteroidetes bacterium]|nr:MAG: hypothetical protein D6730_17895 [Bacteroidota bacterium]